MATFYLNSNAAFKIMVANLRGKTYIGPKTNALFGKIATTHKILGRFLTRGYINTNLTSSLPTL